MSYFVSRIIHCPVAAHDRIDYLESLLGLPSIEQGEVARRLRDLHMEFYFSYVTELRTNAQSMEWDLERTQEFIRSIIVSSVWFARIVLQQWRDNWSMPDQPGPMAKSWDELREMHTGSGCVCQTGVSHGR